MMKSRGARLGAIPLLLATAAVAPAWAQTNTPQQTLPGLDNYSLPSSQQPTPTPTPEPTIAPLPVVTPTPTPRARPTPAATPTPRATPTARATSVPEERPTPEPTLAPTPTPSATPAAAPTTDATPAVTPTAVATPTPGTSASASEDGGWSGWAIGIALLAVAGGAALWWLRRRRTVEVQVESVPVEVAPPAAPQRPVPAPVAPQPVQPAVATPPAMLDPPPVASGDRARLTLVLNPRRAGLNLLSATVEAELVVRNEGSAPSAAIRIGAALIGAAAGQGGEVAPLFAQPVGRPATPPFALAPGEERRVRIVVALARAEIVPLTAGGRALFVPVVAVNAYYDAGAGSEGQNACAFAVGVERVDSAKLAPFWLDQPARMHEQLAARPYGAAMER